MQIEENQIYVMKYIIIFNYLINGIGIAENVTCTHVHTHTCSKCFAKYMEGKHNFNRSYFHRRKWDEENESKRLLSFFTLYISILSNLFLQ